LLMTLGHAWGMSGISSILRRPDRSLESIQGMVGTSVPMRQLYLEIRKVAKSEAPVLLSGESGTGKELTARSIHQLSGRSDKPFIAVNCAALPATLIQSELFGHEKGAFTGAVRRHTGHIEAANEGTIFLDEIGDLPLDLQVNLLRFLEEKVIERVGSTNEIPVNARVIAATHKNIEALVQQGLFRKDLFYRLNVLGLRVPSLRERAEDIELLAQEIFRRFSGENLSKCRGFSQMALNAMARHSWPGNVRELINRIRRAMVMTDKLLISPDDLDLRECSQWNHSLTLEESRRAADRQVIQMTLKHTRNNLSQAARMLGISRTTLYRKLQNFGISV
jgi:DNA-binding NtrC family response regulator